MPFSLPPVGGVSVGGVSPTGYLPEVPSVPGTSNVSGNDDAGSGFAASLTGAVDGLQQLQATSNELAIAAVTGDLTDIHTATLASTRAAVTLELVAAVRNKGVAAFNEIMRMQA